MPDLRLKCPIGINAVPTTPGEWHLVPTQSSPVVPSRLVVLDRQRRGNRSADVARAESGLQSLPRAVMGVVA
jgi:hypothetical protein